MTSRRISSQTQAVSGGLGIQAGGYVHTGSATLGQPVVPGYIQQVSIQPLTSVTLAVPPAPPVADLGAAFKPKKAGKGNASHIIFILDASSSMQSCREQTIKGFNEYLIAQQEDAVKTGIETYVSLFVFTGYDVITKIDRQNVKDVPLLTEKSYNPSGSTNLLDAMGGVMMQVNKLLAEKKKAQRESVIITILTDGEENTSRTFKNADIKAMVEKAEGKDWGFMFLGANIDAFHASSALGFSAQNTMQFNTANATETFRSAAAMSNRMKSAYASGMNTSGTYASATFTSAERASAVGKADE